MRINSYRLACRGISLRAAVVADFHDREKDSLLEALRAAHPDVILVPGDVVHDRDHTANGLAFLREAVTVAPVFCSLGNHELRCGEDIGTRIAATGAQVLDDRYVRFGGLVIGGLTSGFLGHEQGRTKKTPPPKTDWLKTFCAEDGVRVLLSHHPEYYPDHLWDRSIDLVLSGHAHGGQWCFFGRGIFAPGQGLFPYYTAGAYDRRKRLGRTLRLSPEAPIMIVSRGLYNQVSIPRINNPEELLLLDFYDGEKQEKSCTADTENV